MAGKTAIPQKFNVVVVGQKGRLMYEALLFVASLREMDPDFAGRVFVAQPAASDRWPSDPTMRNEEVLAAFSRLGAEVITFENRDFGHDYPYGNKIECLTALPQDEPFVFFDSDTLITGPLGSVPFDFDRPCASRRVSGTWPQIELYGPGYGDIWKSLYDKFGLDFDSTLDLGEPDEYWKRYLYFNAGWFFYRDPRAFAERFAHYAREIRDHPPEAAALQVYDPWLDQVALPLVIHSFGGARATIPDGLLDGTISCHYRTFPLLYARESDAVVATLERVLEKNWIKKAVKPYEPVKRMVLQGRGGKVRAMFDQNDLPRREQAIRNQIKRAGLWMR